MSETIHEKRNRLEIQIAWHKSDLHRAVRRLSKGLPGAQEDVNEAKRQIREIQARLREIS